MPDGLQLEVLREPRQALVRGPVLLGGTAYPLEVVGRGDLELGRLLGIDDPAQVDRVDAEWGEASGEFSGFRTSR